jgi:hypothetical protein
MNPKKIKEKERRRARKLAEEAWEAANDKNLDLAEKIIRRAVSTQPENPVLWNDHGWILGMRGKQHEAEKAFRTAISLAPSFGEPFARLAEIRARAGHLNDAIRLLERAIPHAAPACEYIERLAAYKAIRDCQGNLLADDDTDLSETMLEPASVSGVAAKEGWAQKVAGYDWTGIGERLTREGCVVIPNLMEARDCGTLRQMFDDDGLFAKTVVMDRDDFGRGAYRYFKAPIPAMVDGLRRAVYPHAAEIANQWQGLLNESRRFPDDWEQFRRRCEEAGQTTATPILLKYGPGGFNAPHRDVRGSVFFPIQLAVVLSPRHEVSCSGEEGFCGGKFFLVDAPENKKARQRAFAAGLGDAVLFCTRDRLVLVGRVYGLQPVKHGVKPITAGSRYVLGVPFHEYR